MKRQTNRHKALLAAGLLVAGSTAVTQTTAAQPTDVTGMLRFESGAEIPKGHIKIFLRDPESQPKMRELVAKTQVKSIGKFKSLTFSVTLPPNMSASPTQQIVARLERADGWLLARGSAKLKNDEAVDITLYTAMHQ
ncbi:hypothetical protein GCM10007094_10550 [Pseudovibrio japonicus]|uniref:Uncharacterized protein n=1 Tax=Pseudovibrio japonicus TaxID=366534 RepID=A0ABQ3E5X1_9HYPH|nr:hypothetical protein [Pseudovibrio japonicus]GHB24392.1 hypothetical protein GCM10007094_10550 [Pseudovibrio japonicus]